MLYRRLEQPLATCPRSLYSTACSLNWETTVQRATDYLALHTDTMGACRAYH